MCVDNGSIIHRLHEFPKFAIFGAQVVAHGAYVALRALYNAVPECFLVSRADDNPDKVDGIAVHIMDECKLDPSNTLIIIAVTELLQDEVANILGQYGFVNTFRLTAHEEHLLMSAHFESIGRFPLLKSSGEGVADLAVYETRNHRDKPLDNPPNLQAWEHPIQAGASLTDVRICEILDNAGKNISAKNKQYCEMSAAYWIWKNTSHDWKGLEHYRRHLLVTPDILSDEPVDVVLPLPYICYPNTIAQFRRFVSQDVLNMLLQALKTLFPFRYNEYEQILHGQYHYAYNLVFAKREAYDAYCTWFFGITEYMESLGVSEIENTRALSYVAEVLTNLYFISNSDKLKIRHAEKRIFT